MDAKTDLERLFKARAEMFHEPQAAVRALREVIQRQRSWGIAHAVLADALVRLAWDLGDRTAATGAIQHAITAQEILPDSPRLYTTSLIANLTAAHLSPDDEAKESFLVEADEVAHVLETRYPQFAPREMVVYYDIRENDADKAIAKLRQMDNARNFEIWLRALLYRQGQFREAADEFHCPWAMVEIAEDPDRVADQIEERVRTLPNPGVLRIWEPLMLCALGRRDTAEGIWKELLSETEQIPWNYEYPLMLFTGEWSERDIFDDAKGSRIKTSFAHFCVAHRYLEIELDAEKAEDHFQRFVDLGVIRGDYYFWSKAMLARLRSSKKLPWLRE